MHSHLFDTKRDQQQTATGPQWRPKGACRPRTGPCAANAGGMWASNQRWWVRRLPPSLQCAQDTTGSALSQGHLLTDIRQSGESLEPLALSSCFSAAGFCLCFLHLCVLSPSKSDSVETVVTTFPSRTLESAPFTFILLFSYRNPGQIMRCLVLTI